MRRIHKFLDLSSGERRLLIKTWILLGVIRLRLELFPFSTLRKLLFKLTFLFRDPVKDFSEEYLVWSVVVVSPYIPKTTGSQRAFLRMEAPTAKGLFIMLVGEELPGKDCGRVVNRYRGILRRKGESFTFPYLATIDL
jgi:hypothetical protein